MISKTQLSISVFCLSVLLAVGALAQNRQGNIVQYFGKEKVEDVSEGEVLHVFQQGLILRKTSFRFGSASVSSDPLYAGILKGEIAGIKEGKEVTLGNETLAWESISAQEKSEFRDRSLRSGYLYLSYDSPQEQVVLFEASGHTRVLINGLPHEGDHYDFGWTLIPVKLKKGVNEFVLKGGRFPTMRARLLAGDKPIQFTQRDMTLPDLLREDTQELVGAIRVINAGEKWFDKGQIVCVVEGKELKSKIPAVSPLHVRKVPFSIPTPANLPEEGRVSAVLTLKVGGKVLDVDTITLGVKSKYKHHKKTFVSAVDGSVQYYSVAPSLEKDTPGQAMFLSVHGASVEAVNQANAYRQKEWGHLVAPTNRRPFGFAWEDWGRLDALEVLNHAENIYKTDRQHTYLTGHSMGGHGSWYLGVTYPDRFAAIAPCAGYPDLLGYRNSFVNRMRKMPEENFKRFGMTKEEFFKRAEENLPQTPTDIMLDSMIRRAGNPSRTLKLKRNYLHHGVYVLHGEKDTVVPTYIAREMRQELGTFHNDFTYYEYPDGTHWYGNHSVDWQPIFDFFKARKIKKSEEVDEIEFYTASPGVSDGSHFIRIWQQQVPFAVSSFHFTLEDSLAAITTENCQLLALHADKMNKDVQVVSIDGESFDWSGKSGLVFIEKTGDKWSLAQAPSKAEKGPHRNGGFKDAFRNNMVFVYASKGSREENEWYYNRAKFDAEKFWYRGNGTVEMVKDTDFSPAKYADRNVILYGNKSNNAAWNSLLKDSPVQVSNGKVSVGSKIMGGSQWGIYFVYPLPDSDTATVGVVSATGMRGMKGAYANDYLVNGTTFPDVMLFDDSMMEKGLEGVKCSGFFGNDWSVEKGDFAWR